MTRTPSTIGQKEPTGLIGRQPYLRSRRIRATLALILSAVCSPVVMSETRQLDSHEHGAAILNVAIADGTLSIEYITPAVNIVGFEHVPSTEDQERAVHEAVELLESGKVISIPPEAACSLANAEVEHGGKPHMGEHQEEEHEEGHTSKEHGEHEEHGDGEGSHSEFHVVYQYQCENIDALAHIDVELFAYFSGNEKIASQIITPNGQGGMVLTPNSTRLVFP